MSANEDARATPEYHALWELVGNRAERGNLTHMPEPRLKRAHKGIEDILANPKSGLTQEQQLGFERARDALAKEIQYR